MFYYSALSIAQIILQPVTDKRMNIEHWWNATGRRNGSTRRKSTRSTANFSAWIGPGLNPDHRGDRSQDKKMPSLCPAITVDAAFMGITQNYSNLFSANW